MILACSSDGTVAAIGLENDIGIPLTSAEMKQYMVHLYGTLPPIPIGGPHATKGVPHQRTEPIALNEQKEERVQGGKRRIQPVLLSTPQSATTVQQPAQAIPNISPLVLPSSISTNPFPSTQFQQQRPQIIMTSPNAPPIPEYDDLKNFSLPFFPSYSKVINKGAQKSYTEGICDMKLLEICDLISTDADLIVECMEIATHVQFKSMIRFREGLKIL